MSEQSWINVPSGERRPVLAGDLDAILTPGPKFRIRLRGYERVEVDNYVAWAEQELAAARRLADQALARYGASSAEAAELSRRLADWEQRAESTPSERMREVLVLAAEQAVQMRLSAAESAEQDLRRAREEACAIREEARKEAAELLATVRAQVSELPGVPELPELPELPLRAFPGHGVDSSMPRQPASAV